MFMLLVLGRFLGVRRDVSSRAVSVRNSLSRPVVKVGSRWCTFSIPRRCSSSIDVCRLASSRKASAPAKESVASATTLLARMSSL